MMLIDPRDAAADRRAAHLDPRPHLAAPTRSPTSAAAPTSSSTTDDRAYPTTVDKTVWKVKVQRGRHAGQGARSGRSPPHPRGRLPDRHDAGLGGPDLVLHPAGRSSAPSTRRRARSGPPTSPPVRQITNSVADRRDRRDVRRHHHALYRLDADAGTAAPQVTWREAYDRGSRTKPGNLSQGSGTTPDPDRRDAGRDQRQRRPADAGRWSTTAATGVTDRLHCARARVRRRTPAPPTTAWSRRAARSSSRTTTATRARHHHARAVRPRPGSRG